VSLLSQYNTLPLCAPPSLCPDLLVNDPVAHTAFVTMHGLYLNPTLQLSGVERLARTEAFVDALSLVCTKTKSLALRSVFLTLPWIYSSV